MLLCCRCSLISGREGDIALEGVSGVGRILRVYLRWLSSKHIANNRMGYSIG